METMNSREELLENNLKTAVKNCQLLKVCSRTIDSSFMITPIRYLDFTADKYIDGCHSYKMDALVKISNKIGDVYEERCDIHFDAQINGTDVEIENGMIIVDKNIIPMNWEF
jgi:hypothetical protein